MIREIKLLPYKLQLRPEPAACAGRIPVCREGFLLRLTSGGGVVGWGEAAPLPGRSPESMDVVRVQLERVSGTLLALEGPSASSGWSHQVLDCLTAVPLPSSSLRFAVETAVLDMLGRERAVVWNRDYARDYARTLPLAALLTGTGEALGADMERVLAEGFDTVKIKVGVGDPAAEAAALSALSARVGHRLRLRLDANRAWSLPQALSFAAGVKGCPVAYIEEPVADAADLPRFVEASGLPMAIDETLDASRGGLQLASMPVAAYVIKPMVHGGLSGALRLAERALRRGATPVLSATFESGIGLRALVQLGSVLQSDRVAVGLDTYSRLLEDLVHPPLPLRGPRLRVDAIATAAIEVRLEGSTPGPQR